MKSLVGVQLWNMTVNNAKENRQTRKEGMMKDGFPSRWQYSNTSVQRMAELLQKSVKGALQGYHTKKRKFGVKSVEEFLTSLMCLL